MKQIFQKFIAIHNCKGIYNNFENVDLIEFQKYKNILIKLGSPILALSIAFCLNCDEISGQFREHLIKDYTINEILTILCMIKKFMNDNKFCNSTLIHKNITPNLSINYQMEGFQRIKSLMDHYNINPDKISCFNLSFYFKKMIHFEELYNIIIEIIPKFSFDNSNDIIVTNGFLSVNDKDNTREYENRNSIKKLKPRDSEKNLKTKILVSSKTNGPFSKSSYRIQKKTRSTDKNHQIIKTNYFSPPKSKYSPKLEMLNYNVISSNEDCSKRNKVANVPSSSQTKISNSVTKQGINNRLYKLKLLKGENNKSSN